MAIPTRITSTLTTEAEVKRISRITNEVSASDISSFIKDVSQEVFRDHGWPIKTTSCFVDSTKNTYYIFPQLRGGESAYQVERILIDGSLVDSGSYTVDAAEGKVTLNAGLAATYANDKMHIGWTPSIFNQLATFKVAFDVIQVNHVVSREGGEFPRTAWIKQRIDEVQKQIVDGIYIAKNLGGYNHYEGDFVDQTDLGNSI